MQFNYEILEPSGPFEEVARILAPHPPRYLQMIKKFYQSGDWGAGYLALLVVLDEPERGELMAEVERLRKSKKS